MTKVYFWHGLALVGDEERFNSVPCKKTIEQLLTCQYKSARLEKLHGSEIYSARIDDANRLLFSTISVEENKKHLLLLDVILNHNYKKSPFLKPGVLDKFYQSGFSEQTLDINHFMEAETISDWGLEEKVDLKSTELRPAEYYNQRFIELSDTQQTVKKITLPGIVNGPAGSGKTCIAMSFLIQSVKLRKQDKSKLPILYVTKSAGLKMHMENLWKELPVAHTLKKNAVQFHTYDELLQKLASEVRSKNWIIDELTHFATWLKTFTKKTNKLTGEEKSENFLSDPNLLYQELRIFSAYSREHYLKLGQRQALIKVEERVAFADLAESYLQYLKKENCIAASFYHPEEEIVDVYYRVVPDESQDFSHLELMVLQNMARDKQILFCVDTHQSLLDQNSKLLFLLSLIDKENYVQLKATYRCAVSVINIANEVIRIKNVLAGGKGDQFEATKIEPSPNAEMGEVKWLETLSAEDIEYLQKAEENSNFAVISEEKFKAEVRQICTKTPLLMTTKQIKGLEYDTVFIFRPLDNEDCKNASQQLHEKGEAAHIELKHRAKQDQSDTHFSPALNSLITALTRGKRRVLIYQPYEHKLRTLTNLLSQKTIAPQSSQPLATMELKKEHAWKEQLKIHESKGNAEIVDLIKQKITQEQSVSMPAVKEKREKTRVKKVEQTKVTTTTSPTLLPSAEENADPQIEISSAASSSETKDSPAKTQSPKIKKYVTELLKKVTENNLENAINHKANMSIFFDFFEEGDCLFNRLLSREHFPIFMKVLKAHLDFCRKITVTNLTYRMPRQSIYNLSIFSSLSGSKDGRFILSQLLDNRLFVEGITAADLTYRHTAVADFPSKNTSALYHLAGSLDGRVILSQLLKQNSLLAKGITAADLTCRRTAAALGLENTSVLYFLSSSTDGCAILNELLKQNPLLAEGITAVDLMCRITPPPGKPKNTSVLSCLEGSSEGRSILSQLLKLNPLLANNLKVTTSSLLPSLTESKDTPPSINSKTVNPTTLTTSVDQVTIRRSYWKDKLIAAGCNDKTVVEVLDTNIIENYQKLYRTLLKLPRCFRGVLSRFEFYCLSGEFVAISKYIIQCGGYTQRSSSDYCPVHYVAMSGSVVAMKYIIEVLKLDPTSFDPNGRNVLHYAALSGSVDAMKYAVDVLHIHPDSANKLIANTLLFAAQSGSVAAMEYVINVLKHDPKSVNQSGSNALHFAAQSGSIEAMKYAIDVLKIDPKSVNKTGGNILHYAAQGSVKGVRYVRLLSYKLNLKLDPTVCDWSGHDAFYHADLAGKGLIREILTLPIEKIISQSDNLTDDEDDREILFTEKNQNLSSMMTSGSTLSLPGPSSSSLTSSSSTLFSSSANVSVNSARFSSTSGEQKQHNQKLS